MPRLSLWNSGKKGATYHYIDKMVAQWFGASGTAVYVHLYLGHHDQDPAATPDTPKPGITSIQDVLFLENRDRRYSNEVFELRATYNVNDVDFDLRQFGFFLQNDTLFLSFHLNDMIAQVGRKLIAGDVLELPHLRDDALLDPAAKAVNRFYVVEDVNRAAEGYSPTWFPHVLRVKCSPMSDAQEYRDILDKQAKDPFGFTDGRLRDILSTVGREMEINEEIVESARASVTGRNFETRHFYVIPGEETAGQNPWIFAGDGDPPNGAELVGSGNSFPDSGLAEGDYYLRTDYSPHTLFRYKSGAWRIQEIDYRESEWSVAHRTLKNFINNRTEVTFEDGLEQAERQGLSQAVKPRADF